MAGLPDLKLSPKGLYHGPIALAPRGGLHEAKEIVIRRPGVAEPRPGFDSSAAAWPFATRGTIERMLDFGAEPIGVNSDHASVTTSWAGGNAITDEGSAKLDWLVYAIQGQEMRGNFYLTTSDQLRRLADGATIAYRAGLPVPAVYVSSDAAGDGVAEESFVAYRAVTMNTDANDVTVRSGVSGRAVYQNTSDTDRKNVTVRVRLHKGDRFAAGHKIELYRTLSEENNPPTDELFLAKTVELASGDITAGYVDIVDKCHDDDLGQALYTNESREGLTASHIQPPAAKCIAELNGSLYLGDLTFPASEAYSVPFKILGVAGTGEVGVRSITSGTFTNGSANITVADSSIFKVGQIIANGDGDWAVNTEYIRITAIVNGTTITASSTWNLTTGSYTRSVADSIRIGSQYFVATNISDLVASVRGTSVFAWGTHSASSVATLEADSDDNSFTTTSTSSRKTFAITALGPDVTPPVIYATNGAAYEPALPEPSVTGHTMAQETLPNGVMWSNRAEPEHFQAANVEEVGGGLHRVQALRKADQTLLIFKQEGLARASGHADSGVRFSSVKPGVNLLHPDASASLLGEVFAWCDKGVFMCSDTSEDLVDEGIRYDLEPVQKAIKANASSVTSAWMVANEKAAEIILGIPENDNDNEPWEYDANVSNRLYVLNTKTGAWTTWFDDTADSYCGVYVTDSSQVWLGLAQAALQERGPSSQEGEMADIDYSITISAVSSSVNVTISAGSGWTPAVGDLVVRSGTPFLVTAVTDSTHFTVHATITTGAATAFEAFTSVITPIAATADNPGLLKSWGEGQIWWGGLRGVLSYVLSFTSDRSSTAATQTRTVATTIADRDVPAAYRFVSPRAHNMTQRLYPSVQITQGGSRWSLEALLVEYRLMSPRVRAK